MGVDVAVVLHDDARARRSCRTRFGTDAIGLCHPLSSTPSWLNVCNMSSNSSPACPTLERNMNGLLLSSAPLQVVFVVLSIPHRSCTQSLTPPGLSSLLVQMRPHECRLRCESHFTWWWCSAPTVAAGLREGGGHHGSSQWSRCCRSTQRGSHHNRNSNSCSQPGHQRRQLRMQLTAGGVENKCSQGAKTIWQNWLWEGRRAVSGM